MYQQFELCEGNLMELSEAQHEIPESSIWSYLVDLLLAVEHLHDHGLIHMDIKPENIFLGREGICKLGDFVNVFYFLVYNHLLPGTEKI